MVHFPSRKCPDQSRQRPEFRISVTHPGILLGHSTVEPHFQLASVERSLLKLVAFQGAWWSALKRVMQNHRLGTSSRNSESFVGVLLGLPKATTRLGGALQPGEIVPLHGSDFEQRCIYQK